MIKGALPSEGFSTVRFAEPPLLALRWKNRQSLHAVAHHTPLISEVPLFLVIVPILSGFLIYEGFVGAPNLLGGLAGIALLLVLALMLPRIWRGGEVSFDTATLTVRTALFWARTLRYDEVRQVDQFVNGLPVLSFTCPSLVRSRGRPLLLNDFHAFGQTRDRAARSPKVRTATQRLGGELRIRRSATPPAP